MGYAASELLARASGARDDPAMNFAIDFLDETEASRPIQMRDLVHALVWSIAASASIFTRTGRNQSITEQQAWTMGLELAKDVVTQAFPDLHIRVHVEVG